MRRHLGLLVYPILVPMLSIVAACDPAGIDRPGATLTSVQSCDALQLRAAKARPVTELRKAIAERQRRFGTATLPACEPGALASVVTCTWKGGSTCLVTVCDDVECTSIVDTATNMCDCYKGLCADQLPAPCN